MDTVSQKSAKQACNQFSKLLDAAENGQSTTITRHGCPVAILVPIELPSNSPRQLSLLSMAGTGCGLWGNDSSGEIHRLRDEWDR